MVYLERLKGVLGDRLNALTRKTQAFAKNTSPWDTLVKLCLFEHNWMQSQPALRKRAEGLSDDQKYRQKISQWQ